MSIMPVQQSGPDAFKKEIEKQKERKEKLRAQMLLLIILFSSPI